MTLKEFYEQIDGSYEDTLHRLPSEALVHRFVLKYPADPSFAHNLIQQITFISPSLIRHVILRMGISANVLKLL